jgi:hypothetical protein
VRRECCAGAGVDPQQQWAMPTARHARKDQLPCGICGAALPRMRPCCRRSSCVCGRDPAVTLVVRSAAWQRLFCLLSVPSCKLASGTRQSARYLPSAACVLRWADSMRLVARARTDPIVPSLHPRAPAASFALRLTCWPAGFDVSKQCNYAIQRHLPLSGWHRLPFPCAPPCRCTGRVHARIRKRRHDPRPKVENCA